MYEQLHKLYAEADSTGNLGELDSYLKNFVAPCGTLEHKKRQNNISSVLRQHLIKGTCKLEMVKLFLKYGADPNFVKIKWLPLQLAVKNPNIKPEVIQLLFQHGADVVQKNGKIGYYTVLKHALKNPAAKPQVVKLLLKHCAKANNGLTWYSHFNPLLLLAVRNQNSNPKIINLLLKYGANIHATDSNKNTPLHLALQNSCVNLDVVDTLLLHGADVNIPNGCGISPMQFGLRNCSAVNERFIFSHLRGEHDISNLYYWRQGECDESSLNVCKQYSMEMCTMSMLKHIIIRNRHCDFEEISNSLSNRMCETFLSDVCCEIMDKHHEIPLIRELLYFFIRSIQEVAKMKKDRIDCHFSLQECILDRNKLSVEKIQMHMFEILKIINKKSYPIYNDVIRYVILSLKRKDIFFKLENIQITSIGMGHQKQVSLNFNVLSILAQKLSKKDVLNLLLASEKPKQNKNPTPGIYSFCHHSSKRRKIT